MDSEFLGMLDTFRVQAKEFSVILGNQPTRAKIQFMSGDYVMLKMLDLDGSPIVAMHWTNVVIIGVQ